MILENTQSNKDLGSGSKSPKDDFKQVPVKVTLEEALVCDAAKNKDDEALPEIEQPVKPKGVPKSFKTFGSSTLDESIKGEKDQVDELTQIPNMELLQQQIK